MRVCAHHSADRATDMAWGARVRQRMAAWKPRAAGHRRSPPATLAPTSPRQHARGGLPEHTPPGRRPGRHPDAARARTPAQARSTHIAWPYQGLGRHHTACGERLVAGGLAAPLARGSARLPPLRAGPPPAPRAMEPSIKRSAPRRDDVPRSWKIRIPSMWAHSSPGEYMSTT